MKQQILAVGKISTVFSALLEGKSESEELYARRPDGLVFSTAMALRQAAVPCIVAGTICSDALGRMLLEDLKKSGIDTSALAILNGQSEFSILDEAGRTLFHSDCLCAQKELPEISSELLENCSIVLFGTDMLQTAEEKDWFSSLSPALKAQDKLLIIASACRHFHDQELLSQADILFLDEKSAQWQETALSCLQDKTQAVIILEKDQITLATQNSSRQLPLDPNVPKNLSFGMAALLWFLSGSSTGKDHLQELLSASSVSESLLQCIGRACCTASIDDLSFASLYFKDSSEAMLSFAQTQMDRLAPQVRKSKWHLKYHITAPSGWINDPNGLIQIHGIYHVFYQLHPFSPEWGPMYWGHVTSTDLAHWKHEPIALAPDQPYEGGCFSGSAVNNDGILTLIYTAHKNGGKAVMETQCIARSYDDGKTFVKSPANPVIKTFPKDGSADFRDPKVWKQDGRWQLVVGTNKKKRGRALLYSSADLEHWDYRGILYESNGSQGSMWECPNFCTVDHRDILIFSPVDMKKHKNVYCAGEFDCARGKFTSSVCRELDYGSNFYAAQVFTDESGRVLLIAWMDRWGADFPSQEDGWAGALTIPRVLHMRGETLLQQPAPELKALRKTCLMQESFALTPEKNPLESLSGDSLELSFSFRRNTARRGFTLGLRKNPSDGQRALLIYDGEKHAFAFPYGLYGKQDRIRREFIPCESDSELIDIRIFIDRCSVEIFIDEGALCFTQRIYPSPDALFYEFSGDGTEIPLFEAWDLDDAFVSF